jgi:Tfp pilus assembly protein FimT
LSSVPWGVTKAMSKRPSQISAGSTVPRTGRGFRGASGFSMLELVIVIGISLTVAAIAIPHFLTAYYDVRLKSAVGDLSGFMQKARIQAAKQNATYAIGYRAVTNVEEAYIDLNLNGQWDTGEPLLTFDSAIIPATSVPTGTGGTPTPYVLVGDTSGVVYNNATTLAYSPRGLPCAYTGGVCTTPAAGYFVYYFQDQRPGSTGWGAVIVTRTGRTKTSIWSGTAWD